jgi:hypothetical protein
MHTTLRGFRLLRFVAVLSLIASAAVPAVAAQALLLTTVSLNPDDGTSLTGGTSASFTATVTDADLLPVPGALVTFEVYRDADVNGSYDTHESGLTDTVTTGLDGTATFSYTGPNADARDEVVACVDGNNDDCASLNSGSVTLDSNDPGDSVVVTWIGPHTVTVGITGSGSVTIDSPSGSDSCPPTCSVQVDDGGQVTLTPSPDAGWTFDRFNGGACDGVTGNCTRTVTGDIDTTAVFTRLQYTLTVKKTGDGGGTVTSSPGGIDCGSTCTADFDDGTAVTLTASPNATSLFGGWTGACSGGGECHVTMSSAKTVTASFTKNTYQLSVDKNGTGAGTVTSSPAGINCGSTCQATYDQDTVVTLTATPNGSSTFTGWSGACSGTGTCQVTMGGARSVTATFATITYQLSVDKNGTGAGMVTSSPGQISCGATCTDTFAIGTVVTLSVNPADNSSFTGWDGACTGTGTCQVTMNGPRSVTATFSKVFLQLSVSKDGTGGGRVSSSPAGIDCGPDCTDTFEQTSSVVLTADPMANSSFAGWSGACSGTDTCRVTMSSAKSVTATFTLEFRALVVTKDGLGHGTVTSAPAGIDCGLTCSASFELASTVRLTATPGPKSSFVGWTGDGCDGLTTTTCDVSMTSAKSVTAKFKLEHRTLTVEKSGAGTGSVTSSPAGITCGGDCKETYLLGTGVTLTASPGPTSSFKGWSVKACSGTGTCKVTLDRDMTVTAVFGISDDCTIVGTGGRDRLVGSALNDVICGGGGNDVIWGLAGDDSLIGGSGNDTLIGGPGNDALDGRNGTDTASYIKLTPSRHTRTGVTVDLAAGKAHGTSSGRDLLDRVEQVIGTDRGDTLNGTAGENRLIGNAGADHIDGGRGDDVLVGNGGHDVLTGGPGEDVISGGDDDDRILGGLGRDTEHGGTGDDALLGAENSDRLFGEKGRDDLNGGKHPRGDDRDRCDGGANTDAAELCEMRISVP